LAIRGINGARDTGVVESIETGKQPIEPRTVSQRENNLPPIGSDKLLPDFRTELRKLQITRAFTPQVQTPENKINELKEGHRIPIAIGEKDTQTDVLRKAYAEYAKRAGLSDVAGFAKSMVKDGEVIWHEDGITTFSVTEFEAKRAAGTINMIPGKGDLAAARQARVEELLHCSLFDCSVTADEQKQIVDVLRNDP